LKRRSTIIPNKPSAGRNAQESPLLCLPAELRNRIWTYVLSSQDDIPPDADGQDFKWNLEEIHLDIISVSRQAYAETALLPFALGCFRFRNGWRMLQLLDKTFAEQRESSCRAVISRSATHLPLVPQNSLGSSRSVCGASTMNASNMSQLGTSLVVFGVWLASRTWMSTFWTGRHRAPRPCCLRVSWWTLDALIKPLLTRGHTGKQRLKFLDRKKVLTSCDKAATLQ
jgi:hypothetical protein